VPAYPQYSGTTTASVCDAVYELGGHARATCPSCALSTVTTTTPATSPPWQRASETHWDAHGQPDKLVMSFHGVPERTLHLGDPYHCECLKTAACWPTLWACARTATRSPSSHALARPNGWSPTPSPPWWRWAKAGTQRVDVVCPGFTSDCLETLEEINMEAREAFLHAGGKAFHYIPCLNDDATAWITALAGRWPATPGRLAHAGHPGRRGAGRQPGGGAGAGRRSVIGQQLALADRFNKA
jgi:ferrochelatase